jgi:hypothetical protein
VLSVFGTKFSLPEGTERVDFEDYEEIKIPITKPAPVRTTEQKVLVSYVRS